MKPFMAELVGTALLVLLGDGVVAACVLKKSKAENGGWMVITTGWALAVAIAVYCVGRISGAHLNPAITLALAATGKFAWASVPSYLLAQLAGAILGATLVWICYLPHWEATSDEASKLVVFATVPAIRKLHLNLVTEIIGTFVLVFGVLALGANTAPAASGIAPFLVGVLVWSIGLSLGAPTGYAINPARDLGPRIAHAILPIAGKGSSDWGYSWVPVLGPIIGGVLGAFAYAFLFRA